MSLGIVPSSSAEVGNTLTTSSPLKPKQTPIRKNHFFTYFYKNSSEFQHIEDELRYFAYKAKIQTEICPTTKKPHLQGMLWCRKKCRDTEFKTLKGAHFKPLMDTDNKADYCNKNYSHDGVWRCSWGFPEEVVKVTYDMLRDRQKVIADLFVEREDPLFGRKIYWYWENKGQWGKSMLTTYMIDFCDAVVVDGKKADILFGMQEYYDKQGRIPPIVIFDLARADKNFVSYTAIEKLKNGFFFGTKYKSGMVRFNRPHIIVFSNFEPNLDEDNLSVDRWVITELKH